MGGGYSRTPLAKKLGIKEGSTVVRINAPDNYPELIAPLPDGVTFTDNTANADVIHLFTNSRDELFSSLTSFKSSMKPATAIWVSWYKKAAKLPTEITEDTIREAALPLGFVDVKVCAVDEKWSGLKLVIRKENR
ncbi:MAG: DUF3052 family protein [Blastocatellia bacterium]|nr:DUF3052 family protein [Blastocatellia bacterium]